MLKLINDGIDLKIKVSSCNSNYINDPYIKISERNFLIINFNNLASFEEAET
jgi:hypothetical protein